MRHRVLVSGMGGELGVRVANLLAGVDDVEVVRGIDLDPPRRRIEADVEFVRVDPRDRRKVVPVVRELDPTVVVHLGVYEPNARTGPRLAGQLNEVGTLHTLGAAAECPSLERIVVRSGIEVYGRRRGQATRPDESVPVDPTSSFGRQLARVEELALETGRAAGATVTALRFAPVTGSAMASPLGRYLRLPVVAFGGLTDPAFCLLHQTDAADAVVAAIAQGPDAPINVVGGGATTPAQAARVGGRIALPILGAQWALAGLGAELLGAPLPDHVREVLTRGRVADGGAAADLLGVTPAWTTGDVVRDLYEWAPVTYLRPGTGVLP
jgi:UDP-glucose 4-epimerase